MTKTVPVESTVHTARIGGRVIARKMAASIIRTLKRSIDDEGGESEQTDGKRRPSPWQEKFLENRVTFLMLIEMNNKTRPVNH